VQEGLSDSQKMECAKKGTIGEGRKKRAFLNWKGENREGEKEKVDYTF